MSTTALSRIGLASLVLVCCALLLPGVQASTAPAADTKLFLPFVAKNAPLPEGLGVVQYLWSEQVSPEYEWMFGHVANTSSVPLYSVQLTLPVTGGTCFEVDPCRTDPTVYERVYPAFAATLPNQPNPYRSSWHMQWKYYFTFGNVQVDDVERTSDQTYEALTITDVGRNPTDMSKVRGTVRNDTDHVIHGARVVIYVPNACPWEEATLDTTTLEPGQSTPFRAESYIFRYHPCRDVPVQAVAQGTVEQ